jgi:hypothetical protein
MSTVTDKTEDYKGFIISWQEPPLTSAKWTANVATENRHLLALIKGAGIIDGRTREDMLAKAKQYIDDLLKPSV